MKLVSLVSPPGRRALALVLCLAAGSLTCLAAESEPAPLSKAHKQWLDRDVLYIISEDEVRSFKALPSDQQRDLFIELFWSRRTQPGGDPQAAKDEHYRRFDYANEHFHAGIPGWRTDRGRVYITLGPPTSRRRNSMGSGGFLLGIGGLDRSARGGHLNRPAEYPSEAWSYNYVAGAVGNTQTREYYFIDRSYTGVYELSTNRGDANIFHHTLHPDAEMGQPTDPFDELQNYYALYDVYRAPAAELQILDKQNARRPARTEVRSEISFGGLAVWLETAHYAAAKGRTRLDVSVHVPPAKDAEVPYEIYGQVVDHTGRVAVNFGRQSDEENQQADQSVGLQATGSFELKPGAYAVAVAVADLANGAVGTRRQEIFVPGYGGRDLQLSSLVLSRRLEPSDASHLPFVSQGWQAVPEPGARFDRTRDLVVFFEIYNAPHGPDAALEVAYLLLSADGPVASLGERQRLEPQGEGPVACTSRLSLKNTSPGSYRLAVRVEDTVSGEHIWQKAPLHID